MVVDGAERAWQDALVRIGLEDMAGAVRVMSPLIENPQSNVRHRLAAQYLVSIQSREDAEAFIHRCKKSGMDTATEPVQSAMLEVVDDLLNAENVDLALDMYMSWLKAPRNTKVSPQHGIEVGLAVSHMLMSADQYDLHKRLLRQMGRLFPHHEELKKELKELEENEQE
jgi:hypothetical protein